MPSEKRVARRLATLLEANGFEVWWDDGRQLWQEFRRKQTVKTIQESHYMFDTLFPEHWRNTIEGRLESSEHLIVLLSPRLPKSDDAIKEILYFQQSRVKIQSSEGIVDPCRNVIPVLIKGDEFHSIPYLGDCMPILDFRPENSLRSFFTGERYRRSQLKDFVEQIFLRTGYTREQLLHK